MFGSATIQSLKGMIVRDHGQMLRSRTLHASIAVNYVIHCLTTHGELKDFFQAKELKNIYPN